MQLKFNDGTVLETLKVDGKSTYFQGANRDSLEIQLAKDTITFNKLDKLTADSANTVKLIAIDDDKQYQHDNYTLRTELSLKPVTTPAATSTAPAVTEDRLCVTLAQKTYSEIELDTLKAQVAALQGAK